MPGRLEGPHGDVGQWISAALGSLVVCPLGLGALRRPGGLLLVIPPPDGPRRVEPAIVNQHAA